jgi:hypothetical protein
MKRTIFIRGQGRVRRESVHHRCEGGIIASPHDRGAHLYATTIVGLARPNLRIMVVSPIMDFAIKPGTSHDFRNPLNAKRHLASLEGVLDEIAAVQRIEFYFYAKTAGQLRMHGLKL